MIAISLEVTKVEIGVGGPLLTKLYQRYGDLAIDGWVKHTWKFLDEHGMTIEDNVGDLTLWWSRDVHLTDAFIQHGYKGTALQ